MTRQELDDRLLDYLYDELEASERGAFERALPSHPEVIAEVEAHRATRRAYQALPREVVPTGILADVLAQADAEAARRAALKTHVSLWEKVRRVLFQPAFAMAMVVLLVAGVSLINARKNELPGMAPARDSQQLPPVAMEAAPAMRGANMEPPSESEGLRAMVAQKAEEAAADQMAPAPAAVTGMVVDGLVAPIEGPGRADDERPKREAQGAASGSDKAKGAPAGGKAIGGVAADEQAFVEKREAGGTEADSVASVLEDTRRPSNTVAPAPRAAAEQEETKPTVTRADKVVKSDPTTRDADQIQPMTPEPSVDSEKLPADVPAKGAERSKVAPPASPPSTKPDADRAETKTADSPARDDGDTKKKDSQPETLTPPLPSAEALWSTYRKQSEAGAYADASRSIEALAKVEGESTRVKEARAALKLQLEAAKRAADDAKVPPQPSGSPPK